ncbi:Predicted kinase [Arboricoccus pini]|uniref:Predicted kinase n=1 Tax=Arboricoccus pini TaxID=1963835 RepID=A0A212RDT6_9PROT|nr:ATP-binding protein [Arboricoccus pini]SNB70446.1 Predicted kinase [Arboricoccus pini]
MPVIHLIHGYLGVGKTTLARRLERDCPAMRFTHDEWMIRLCGDDPPESQFKQMYPRVLSLITDQWHRCIELGQDVVLDSGYWSRAERDEIRAQAAELGAEIRLYDVRCPDDEAWARLDRRNAHGPGELLVTRSTFETLRANFEPLAEDEERVIVENAA